MNKRYWKRFKIVLLALYVVNTGTSAYTLLEFSLMQHNRVTQTAVGWMPVIVSSIITMASTVFLGFYLLGKMFDENPRQVRYHCPECGWTTGDYPSHDETGCKGTLKSNQKTLSKRLFG